MARVKHLNKIFDIKLNTIEDIADASANEVVDQVRNKKVIKGSYSPKYAAMKRMKGRSSRETSFIDLTFDGTTLNSYMRLPQEATKNSQTVGFSNKEAANVAKGWDRKGYNLFAQPVIKSINKLIDKNINKDLNKNFDQASGRTTITIG